jgi:hypothetical protein
VLVGVVEDHRAPFGPVTRLRVDADPALLGRFGDQQAEVVAHHALVRAAMRREVLPRREDREERGLHSGDLPTELRRLRAARDVRLRGEPVAVEEERLPAVVGRHRRLVDRDVLEVRQVRLVLEHGVELGPDLLPARLESRRPDELIDLEEWLVADQRRAPEPALERLQGSLAERDRELNDAISEPGHGRHATERKDVPHAHRPKCSRVMFRPAKPAKITRE